MVIFAAFLYHVGRMVFGEPGEGEVKGEGSKASLVLMGVLLGAVLILGIYVPGALNDIIGQIVRLFPGGGA